MLLKLDTIKAFDCLGWFFLARLLAQIGCGPKFTGMVEAMYASTTASVLVQEWLSTPIPLKRSLCQGYPLSPLLFLIVANALSSMISKAAERGLIRGVPIPVAGEQYTHGQFADDPNVILEAKKEYMEATFDIFRCMGKASRLFVKEEGVKVVLIFDLPMMDEIKELNFNWEKEMGMSKLLGFYVGEDIFAIIMTNYLTVRGFGG